MLNTKLKGFSLTIWALLMLLTINSCSDNNEDEKEEKGKLVITEIMAANHAGLLAKDGELYDWIEIKNISSEAVSVKDYSLAFEKSDKKKGKSKKKDGKGKKKDGQKKKASDEKKADKDTSSVKTWSFPDMEIKPGKCIIVFASKKSVDDDEKASQGELHASFKLSASGGKLQLLKDDDVVSEVSYSSMEDDMCYRLNTDSVFETSYEQTPGFDNTTEGFESYCNLLEQQRKATLKIWEVHSKGYKNGRAWIELKNTSDEPIDLDGYELTTSKKGAPVLTLPSRQLQPGGTYVLDCRKENLKIGSTKSVLLTKKGEFADGVCPAPTPFGVSIGRITGKNGFFYFPSPTRNAENTSTSYRHIAKQPSFNPTPNVYSGKKNMKVCIATNGFTVHYTTDGSMPSTSSPVYKDSININKTTLVRAFCEGDSTTMRSNTVSGTFIFAEPHTMPVMNITVSEADLYDYNRGIYEEGPGASSEYPHYGANYWMPWWKRAHVEFFDSVNGGFSAGCELAIFGGFSRLLAKKSFKIRFRDECGPAHLDYDLYNEGKVEEVKNFVLRSGSQDISGVMVRDEFFTSLMKPNSPSLLIQSYRPVALYINGKYFGLYYIREKINKRFVERHLDLSTDSMSIIMSGMYCEEGTKKEFQDLMNYASTHNLAEKECYNYVKDRFDLTGLIDFKLGQMYSCNLDLGNVRYVLPYDPQSDHKWHVIYYDLDATWASEGAPSTYFAKGDNRVKNIQNHLIQALLNNQEFRQLFLQRLSLHMHKTFSTKNATAVFDNLIKTIKPEMPRNCERWPAVLTYPKWESHVKSFRERFKERNKTMLNDLRKWLSITEEENKKYFSDLGY